MDLNKYNDEFINKNQELFEALEIKEEHLTESDVFNMGYYKPQQYFLLLVEVLFEQIEKHDKLPYATLFLLLNETFTELKDIDLARIIIYVLGKDALVKTIEELNMLD